MDDVLIVGNVLKDVYLRLDNRKNHFETDQNKVAWLDLAFNGSCHNYFSRVAIYGGASISLEVCARFDLKARLSDPSARFEDGRFKIKQINLPSRYMLCLDDQVSYLSPSELAPTPWQETTPPARWLFVDRSACLNANLAQKLNFYLQNHPDTKLALFISEYTNQLDPVVAALISRADFIIHDTKLARITTRPHARIAKDHIALEGTRIFWTLSGRANLLTRLSAHSIIAATILAALIKGKSHSEALLMARANVENSTLNGSANLKKLENAIAGKNYHLHTFAHNDDHALALQKTAQALLAYPRGILAADESSANIHQKFVATNIPDDAQHRRDYRNLLFTTKDLAHYLNGIILFDETARQTADDGKDFVSFLKDLGLIVGIKVDEGLAPLNEIIPSAKEEDRYTRGLENLPRRLNEYYALGIRFAKWRAAFTDQSSALAINKNAEILAQYAKLCQTHGLVPMVEPEFIYDGDYPLSTSVEYTGKILDALFLALKHQQVYLPGCILKVNMVLAGKRFSKASTPAEVGAATAELLTTHVPHDLAGIVFLSGGQSVTNATANLRAIMQNGPFPWPVTFSFARALQEPALLAWRGEQKHLDAARAAFLARLIANTRALQK